MTFRRGAAGKRRDAVEPAIADALRAVGCKVYYVSGRGLPDLIAFKGSQMWAFECKSKGGTLTKAQADIPWPVVRSVSEALAVLGIAA